MNESAFISNVIDKAKHPAMNRLNREWTINIARKIWKIKKRHPAPNDLVERIQEIVAHA